MSRAPQVGEIWEYGHPGPEFKVLMLLVDDRVLVEGVRHPAADPKIESLRLRAELSQFTEGRWRLLRPSTPERRTEA